MTTLVSTKDEHREIPAQSFKLDNGDMLLVWNDTENIKTLEWLGNIDLLGMYCDPCDDITEYDSYISSRNYIILYNN